MIAKAAGVSASTVSRVINGKPGVSERKSREIWSLIEEFNLQPAHLRRPRLLNVNKTSDARASRTIALVQVGGGSQRHPDLFTQMLNGIIQAVEDCGMELMIFKVKTGQPLPISLTQGEVAGVLWAGNDEDGSLIKSLSPLPVVSLTSRVEGNVDHVLPGNAAAGSCAAQYLIQENHKRLAFLNPVPDSHVFARRGEGFCQVADKAGIPVCILVPDKPLLPNTRVCPRHISALAKDLVERLCAMKKRPTGMFVPSDIIAAAIYPMLARRGVLPGRDIHIVSFGDQEVCLLGLEPRPATINIGQELMACRAVEQLVWRIQHPDETRPFSVSIEPLLIPPSTSQERENIPLC
ncbi:MAG: LacI family DNA-binding transcriptional regulator [Phycisphaeraceae bacterium]|nr:LacI family DNA-binding transcriptional regulator [Phycisphaeraceae bacterium]